jgi:hypothetical protein
LGEKLFNRVDHMIDKNDESIEDMVKNKKNSYAFWNIMNRIMYEFKVLFPEEYSKYYKWCSHPECLLPKDIMQNILLKNNYDDFVDYLIKQIF